MSYRDVIPGRGDWHYRYAFVVVRVVHRAKVGAGPHLEFIVRPLVGIVEASREIRVVVVVARCVDNSVRHVRRYFCCEILCELRMAGRVVHFIIHVRIYPVFRVEIVAEMHAVGNYRHVAARFGIAGVGRRRAFSRWRNERIARNVHYGFAPHAAHCAGVRHLCPGAYVVFYTGFDLVRVAEVITVYVLPAHSCRCLSAYRRDVRFFHLSVQIVAVLEEKVRSPYV